MTELPDLQWVASAAAKSTLHLSTSEGYTREDEANRQPACKQPPHPAEGGLGGRGLRHRRPPAMGRPAQRHGAAARGPLRF